MKKSLALFAILIFLIGCSSRKLKIEDGYLIHEDLYQAPILSDQSWIRFIPAKDPIDALFLRCPTEQRIAYFYVTLCGKYDYDQMALEDYPKRIYQNTYSFGWYKGLCPESISRMTDGNFKQMISPPLINKNKKQFAIVYESTYKCLCNSNTTSIPIKVMDVFFEEQKYHFKGGAHTRFVVFRYASSEEQFDNGLNTFQEVISKFQWLQDASDWSFW